MSPEEFVAWTPDEFVTRILDSYSRAHLPFHPHEKLCRGESRSVASETEDLLSYYLAIRISEIDRIFINQPLTWKGNPGLKPDLVICAGSVICAFVDLKMDLGYKRDQFPSILVNTEARMEKLRGQTVSLKGKGQNVCKRIDLSVAVGAQYLFAVVSDQNISAARYTAIEKIASLLTRTRLHTLTRKCHPNHPISREELAKRIVICTYAFEALESEIRKLVLNAHVLAK